MPVQGKLTHNKTYEELHYACANGDWKQLKIVTVTRQTSFTQAEKRK